MAAGECRVREATTADEEAWLEMWADFVDAKPSEPGNRDTAATNWRRCIDGDHPLQCILAVDADGRPQGFLLYLPICFTWSPKDICYLQDVYVRPDVRGQGYGRALIEHLAGIGRELGWYKIFWMTESDNERAQRFYRSLAKQMDYIRYDLQLSEP